MWHGPQPLRELETSRRPPGVPSPICWRRWIKSRAPPPVWSPITRRTSRWSANDTSSRVICSSDPKGGDAPIRLGIFAAIHGDEPEGAYALLQFVELLESKPELAAGYCLSLYPLCNPTGFEDKTRHSRAGKDLNREFWKGSAEPEVGLLQAELVSRSFHGIIALHTDDTCDGFYGIVGGATLTKHLIEPALQAAEALLPRDERLVIDGLAARGGIVHETPAGVLSAPPNVRPRPFEIILETQNSGPPI